MSKNWIVSYLHPRTLPSESRRETGALVSVSFSGKCFALITSVQHRPWPLPDRPWMMAMRWHDLLFSHWPVDVALLRPLIPAELQIDTYDGQAWIGVVPFHMTGVRPRFVPALPGLSTFAEINVRTYVTAGGKPGVWFFSLDAANRIAVRGARWSYNLPYFFARMELQTTSRGIGYASSRRGGAAHFSATYGPTGD